MRTSADALGSFVGRQPELDLVAGLLADASSGSARVVLVFGDAGLGKTALLGAAARRAGTEVLVLSGACLMLSATSVPFLAIRSLVRSCPPAPSAGSVPGFDGVEPSDALLRFDAWLDRLCAERTVMLIVDDLHWADESTLDLLTYLLAGPADRRLLVAGTIRSGEAPDGSRCRPGWRMPGGFPASARSRSTRWIARPPPRNWPRSSVASHTSRWSRTSFIEPAATPISSG